MNNIAAWFRRQAENPQIVILVLVMLAIAAVIYVAGNMLTPLIAAVVIAYLLQGGVDRLQGLGLPHLPSVITMFLVFMAGLIVAVVWLLPLLIRQLTQLFAQTPAMIGQLQGVVADLSVKYPNVVGEEQVDQFLATIGREAISTGQQLLSYSMSSLVALVTIGVYLILVPFLVFFLIRDKDRIIEWFTGFLPAERQLTNEVWMEVNAQIGNYVGGKVIEILIVGITSLIVFALLDLQYAVLLAVLTGLSVLIPYVGAAVVTLPVAIVAFFQWGLAPDFYYVLIAYGIIQALDGNVLAPLLFSEAVDLHPVAIIVAILVFGGIWGFWGVFFAIPLATVIKAVLRAWPRAHGTQERQEPTEA